MGMRSKQKSAQAVGLAMIRGARLQIINMRMTNVSGWIYYGQPGKTPIFQTFFVVRCVARLAGIVPCHQNMLLYFIGLFMSRQRQSPIEGVMDVAARLPWPAGIGLAALAYGALHYLASAQAMPFEAEVLGHGGSRDVGAMLFAACQYVLPALFLLVSALSFLRRRQLSDVPVDVVGSYETDALEHMSRQEFDALVAKAFRREGYLVVERAGGPTDRGVDLELFMGRDRYLVQCRRWREPNVDVTSVRDLYRAISTERAVGGFIVTSGTFTEEARVVALGRSIRLVPADSLRAMLAMGSDMSISPGFSRRRDDPVPPACPKCGKAMMPRTVTREVHIAKHSWICTSFPACQGIRDA